MLLLLLLVVIIVDLIVVAVSSWKNLLSTDWNRICSHSIDPHGPKPGM